MTATATATVAANVRAELARRSVTQTQLAAKLGTTQQYVSRRLTGSVPLDVEDLAAIAGLLNITVAVLIGEAATA